MLFHINYAFLVRAGLENKWQYPPGDEMVHWAWVAWDAPSVLHPYLQTMLHSPAVLLTQLKSSFICKWKGPLFSIGTSKLEFHVSHFCLFYTHIREQSVTPIPLSAGFEPVTFPSQRLNLLSHGLRKNGGSMLISCTIIDYIHSLCCTGNSWFFDVGLLV